MKGDGTVFGLAGDNQVDETSVPPEHRGGVLVVTA